MLSIVIVDLLVVQAQVKVATVVDLVGIADPVPHVLIWRLFTSIIGSPAAKLGGPVAYVFTGSIFDPFPDVVPVIRRFVLVL